MSPTFLQSDYLIFVQTYSINLDGACADFFRAESMLSELTLAETLPAQEPAPGTVSLSRVQQMFEHSAGKVIRLIDLIDSNEELLRTVIGYHDFYLAQRKLFIQLTNELIALSTSAPRLQEAMNNKRLQESLLHDAENANVRTSGIAATRIIGQILASHSDTVEETNE